VRRWRWRWRSARGRDAADHRGFTRGHVRKRVECRNLVSSDAATVGRFDRTDYRIGRFHATLRRGRAVAEGAREDPRDRPLRGLGRARERARPRSDHRVPQRQRHRDRTRSAVVTSDRDMRDQRRRIRLVRDVGQRVHARLSRPAQSPQCQCRVPEGGRAVLVRSRRRPDLAGDGRVCVPGCDHRDGSCLVYADHPFGVPGARGRRRRTDHRRRLHPRCRHGPQYVARRVCGGGGRAVSVFHRRYRLVESRLAGHRCLDRERRPRARHALRHHLHRRSDGYEQRRLDRKGRGALHRLSGYRWKQARLRALPIVGKLSAAHVTRERSHHVHRAARCVSLPPDYRLRSRPCGNRCIPSRDAGGAG